MGERASRIASDAHVDRRSATVMLGAHESDHDQTARRQVVLSQLIKGLDTSSHEESAASPKRDTRRFFPQMTSVVRKTRAGPTTMPSDMMVPDADSTQMAYMKLFEDLNV